MKRQFGKVAGRQILVRALIAFALVAIAFGHQPLHFSSPRQPSAAELAAFALPDGSLPVICFGNDGVGSGHDKSVGGAGCDACRLTASIALPLPPCDLWREVANTPTPTPVEAPHIFVSRAFPPAAPPTAPPLA